MVLVPILHRLFSIIYWRTLNPVNTLTQETCRMLGCILLTSYPGRGFKSPSALHSSQWIVPSYRAVHNLNQCHSKQNPRAQMNRFTLPKTNSSPRRKHVWHCVSLCKLKMATKIRQFYRPNFVSSANIPLSRKPTFMLPLRLPIKVTLYKLRLSAYRNFSALLYHHRHDLASFFYGLS